MSYQVADVRSRSIGVEGNVALRSFANDAPSGFDITMIVLLLLLVVAAVIILLVLAFRKTTNNGGNGTLTFSYLQVNPINPPAGAYNISWSVPSATRVSITPTTYLSNPTAANNLPASGSVDLSNVKASTTYTLTAVDAKGNSVKKSIRVIHSNQ